MSGSDHPPTQHRIPEEQNPVLLTYVTMLHVFLATQEHKYVLLNTFHTHLLQFCGDLDIMRI